MLRTFNTMWFTPIGATGPEFVASPDAIEASPCFVTMNARKKMRGALTTTGSRPYAQIFGRERHSHRFRCGFQRVFKRKPDPEMGRADGQATRRSSASA